MPLLRQFTWQHPARKTGSVLYSSQLLAACPTKHLSSAPRKDFKYWGITSSICPQPHRQCEVKGNEHNWSSWNSSKHEQITEKCFYLSVSPPCITPVHHQKLQTILNSPLLQFLGDTTWLLTTTSLDFPIILSSNT